MKAYILLLIKTEKGIYLIRTNFLELFGLFYDFFVFYNVDFFTECFLHFVLGIYHYNEQMTQFICRLLLW